MKRFRFSLDGLLRVRRRQTETRRRSLRELQAEFAGQQKKLEGILFERERQLERSRELEAGELPLEEVLQRQRYLNVLFRDGLRLGRELREFGAKVERARMDLAQARREQQAVERLRERRYEEWLESVRREEASELDEVGLRMHERRQRESRGSGVTP